LSGGVPVFMEGKWWTVLSASWLHGSLLHILFNMMWVRQLGPATAEMYGAGRMVIVYTAGGVAGFFLSSLAWLVMPALPIIGGAPYTLGASAAIFGLLGALVYYGQRSGSSIVHREAMGYATTLFIMGLIMPGIDNYAHAGGFAGGYLSGKWLDPLKPERMDHFVGAALCILATAVAILASLVPVLPELWQALVSPVG
jgi:rhomboid protease GluP